MDLSSKDPFLCIGHRGAMGYEPENTLRSVRKALELGCSWVEVDVYCVEGELIVIHDDRLERTTNGVGRVMDQSFKSLRALDAGKGEKIPTLREVLDLLNKKAGINVELKGPGTAQPLAAIVREYQKKAWDRNLFLVSSFDHRELRKFKALCPEINLGALIVGHLEEESAFAERLGCFSVNPSQEFIDQEFVDDAHSRGLKVFVFTVNHPEDIERMRNLGVDGVFTNYPDRVLAARSA